MELFRFLFAPVLLAVAVLSAHADRHAAPVPSAVSHAPASVVSDAERGVPSPEPDAAPARHASVHPTGP